MCLRLQGGQSLCWEYSCCLVIRSVHVHLPENVPLHDHVVQVTRTPGVLLDRDSRVNCSLQDKGGTAVHGSLDQGSPTSQHLPVRCGPVGSSADNSLGTFTTVATTALAAIQIRQTSTHNTHTRSASPPRTPGQNAKNTAPQGSCRPQASRQYRGEDVVVPKFAIRIALCPKHLIALLPM